MQSFDDIAADLSFLDDWDARFEYLIDLGRALPAFPAEKRSEANRVKGCASQVWLDWRRDGDRLVLAGDSDAHIVKGLVALTLALFSGRTCDEIAAIDAQQRFAALGLDTALTPQRSNGLAAMVARIKAIASVS
jgi:cysteine desulfuration protein SufE